VRSQALALATFVNFAANAGVSLVLPSLQEGLGMQVRFANLWDVLLLHCLSSSCNTHPHPTTHTHIPPHTHTHTHTHISPHTHTHPETLQATYALFAAVGVAAVANIYFNVPETKNKTLEEIEELWRK
jgi:hypothetical protein